MKSNTALLHDLHAQIPALIKRAGAFALKEFKSFSSKHIEFKGKNNMFTYVDVRTEEILKEGLNELLPGAGFINEESDNQEGETDYTWIIDPIDGTTNFIHGVPLFAICVALQYQDEIMLGYIYEVSHDEMYSAVVGEGAFLNDEPIRVSVAPTLSDSLVGTGFPYRQGPGYEDYLRLVTKVLKETHGMRRLGSAAIDLAYVAAGRLEGFLEFGLSPWDVAAGALIVQEAGGTVTDFKGGDNYIFGKRIIATNGLIHNEAVEIIRSSGVE
ncbi:MAG: inositol monophosphatase [Bacteroidia bacterium]